MTNKTNGFTLSELLVASSIFLILLAIVSQSLIRGGQVTQKIVVESDLLEDARAMGNMIADKITRALYIYPPGAQLELSTTGEVTTFVPGTSSSLWTVGTDPIMAFLERPEDTTAPCSSTQPEGCVFFNAYYPVERSVITQSSGPYPYLNNPNNNTAWVLFEYRKRLNLTYTTLSSGSTPPPTGNAVADEVGDIVADYLIANGFTLSFDRCHDDAGFINDSDNDGVPDCNGLSTTTIYESVVNGSFQLEQSRKQKSTFKGVPLEFAIAPRNLFNPNLN